MIHPARVDRWLAALLGGAVLLELVVASLVLNAALTTDRPSVPVAVGVCAACAAGAVLLSLALWGCYKIRYEVTSTELLVRYWPFRTRVPLEAIVEVVPTSNPLSAPAPSLDRLCVNYRRGSSGTTFVLISPLDKEAFVRDLARAAPQLQRIGADPLHLKVAGPGG
jgi:hypothetical protein